MLRISSALIATMAAIFTARADGAAPRAVDIELGENVPVAMSHRMDFVREHSSPEARKAGVWRVDAELWRAAAAKTVDVKQEDVSFSLWLPGDVDYVRGVIAITGHGAGTPLYKHAELRKLARELKLALFMFNGNPMQRGFWPSSLLYDKLKALGARAKHPELEHAPLFLFGHSNGTGFSAVFTSMEAPRVWGWISMRPGTTMMVDQPSAAQVPGMIMFGEDDPFFAQKSKQQNMAIVERMRKDHNVLWHYAVEPKTAHGPGEKSWTLVFSFLRHSFAARVPADADPRLGPVKLNALTAERGYLGKNWNAEAGGYQKLPIAPFAEFTNDKSTASWLLNAEYAADWQQFQHTGIASKKP
jgi:hypothetical protein